MKLDVTGAPATLPLLEPAVQATHDRQITAVRRARLTATRCLGAPADYRRALRAVFSSPV